MLIRLKKPAALAALVAVLALLTGGPGHSAAQEEKITTDTGYVVFRIGAKEAVVKGPNVAKFAPALPKRPASVEGASVITMDAAPFIENDRTFVPVRYLANALGVADANVGWNESIRLVTLAEPGFPAVEMTVGEKRIISNGKETATDVAPVIRSNRTMLPAKYVAEALGYTVEWDGATKTVLAYRGEKPPKEELEKVYKEFATLKAPEKLTPEQAWARLHEIGQRRGIKSEADLTPEVVNLVRAGLHYEDRLDGGWAKKGELSKKYNIAGDFKVIERIILTLPAEYRKDNGLPPADQIKTVVFSEELVWKDFLGTPDTYIVFIDTPKGTYFARAIMANNAKTGEDSAIIESAFPL